MVDLEFARRRVIVTAAPNGARRGKQDHRAIPITPDELAACAVSLLDVGVAVLHLHVRDERGTHTLDPDAYRAAIAAIRARIGDRLIIQVTTEAAGCYTRAEQMAVVRELKPEAVSLGLRELCPDASCEAEAAAFYDWLNTAGIWSQHILYSPEEVRRFETLRRKGLFAEDHPCCLFVLGRYGDFAEGRPAELRRFLEAADSECCPWAACCFGKSEHEAMLAATRAGGHVRLGFENNLWLPDGTVARDNAALIDAYLSALANARDPIGRRPAGADEIRAAFSGS